MRVMIKEKGSYLELKKEINEWLSRNEMVDVIDIKYSSYSWGTHKFITRYSAMIIYK